MQEEEAEEQKKLCPAHGHGSWQETKGQEAQGEEGRRSPRRTAGCSGQADAVAAAASAAAATAADQDAQGQLLPGEQQGAATPADMPAASRGTVTAVPLPISRPERGADEATDAVPPAAAGLLAADASAGLLAAQREAAALADAAAAAVLHCKSQQLLVLAARLPAPKLPEQQTKRRRR